MAVISRRPRLMVRMLFTYALLGSACSLVKPIEVPMDRLGIAKTSASEGRHADAARAYAELATQNPGESDNYQLLSAEQWVAAGRVAEAKQAFAAISVGARTSLGSSRAIVAAEIAVADNDGAGALRELVAIGVPTAGDLAQNYWLLRGQGAFLTGQSVDGTRAYIERERYLQDPASLRASREDLFIRLRNAAEHGQPTKVPPKSEPILAGWLELGAIALELERDPMHAATALEAWRRAYPQHPANDSVLALAQQQVAAATEFPEQIALILPLSGRAEPVGVAVRDGFIAAYLEQPAGARPRLRIYDSADSVATTYQQAIADGATFVVGPLTKEHVAALVPLSNGHTQVLALNFLADSLIAPPNFYQFALLPEDEARSVARRLAADGKLRGVALVPDGDWGDRVGAAFADELAHLGGAVLETGRYTPGKADFSDVIKQTLQVHAAKGEPATHRGDAAFVFAAGIPSTERLLVSQLKFYFAGDLPMYATSDSFEPDGAANGDLDGLLFPDMPWMISVDPVTTRIRDAVRAAWPARTARRDRLYAFGFDAYRLVPALRANALTGSREVNGLTGKLRLDERNRVRRELVWAQIKGGAAAEL